MKHIIFLLAAVIIIASCSLAGSWKDSGDIKYLPAMTKEELADAYYKALFDWASARSDGMISSVSIRELQVDDLLMDSYRNGLSAANTDVVAAVTVMNDIEISPVIVNDIYDSFRASINGTELMARLRGLRLIVFDEAGKMLGSSGMIGDGTNDVPAKREFSSNAALISEDADSLYIQTSAYEFCEKTDKTYYQKKDRVFGHNVVWLRRFGIDKDTDMLISQIVMLSAPSDESQRSRLMKDMTGLGKAFAGAIRENEKCISILKDKGVRKVYVEINVPWNGENNRFERILDLY